MKKMILVLLSILVVGAMVLSGCQKGEGTLAGEAVKAGSADFSGRIYEKCESTDDFGANPSPLIPGITTITYISYKNGVKGEKNTEFFKETCRGNNLIEYYCNTENQADGKLGIVLKEMPIDCKTLGLKCVINNQDNDIIYNYAGAACT